MNPKQALKRHKEFMSHFHESDPVMKRMGKGMEKAKWAEHVDAVMADFEDKLEELVESTNEKDFEEVNAYYQSKA
jgi:hypothetical protein